MTGGVEICPVFAASGGFVHCPVGTMCPVDPPRVLNQLSAPRTHPRWPWNPACCVLLRTVDAGSVRWGRASVEEEGGCWDSRRAS